MTKQDDLLNFYKELCHKECDRKEQITNSLNIQIGIITGFLTIQFYLITSFDFEVLNKYFYFFIATCFITFVLSIISIYNLLLTYSNFLSGHKITGLPTAKEIEDYRIELLNFYANSDEIDLQFKDYLIKEYIRNNDSLLCNNDKKVKYLFRSKKYSILGLIFILISSLQFLFNFFNKPDKVEKVNISNIQTIEKYIKNIQTNTDSLIVIGNKIKKDSIK